MEIQILPDKRSIWSMFIANDQIFFSAIALQESYSRYSNATKEVPATLLASAFRC